MPIVPALRAFEVKTTNGATYYVASHTLIAAVFVLGDCELIEDGVEVDRVDTADEDKWRQAPFKNDAAGVATTLWQAFEACDKPQVFGSSEWP